MLQVFIPSIHEVSTMAVKLRLTTTELFLYLGVFNEARLPLSFKESKS
jgi:LEA14-like dessication related protein